MARTPTKSRSSAGSPPVTLPKKLVVGALSIDPSTNRGADTPITDSRVLTLNKSIADVRTESTAYKALRLLRRLSGDTATATSSQVRLANTPLSFHVYDANHQLSADGSLLIKGLLNTFENSSDYTRGYDERMGLKGLIDTLMNEVVHGGGVGLELVLDKARLPYKLVPVSASTLKWKTSPEATGPNKNKIIPYQQAAGQTIELDIATFFYQALDSFADTVYPESMMEPALNAAVFQAETLEDIRRVVRRSGHSRLVTTLDVEKTVQSAPMEIRNDPEEMTKWLEATRDSLKLEIEALDPQSALVLFNNIEASYLNSEIGASADYKPLVDIIDGMTSTALRTPPSALGKRMAGGSQNISSTESLLFIKHVAALQTPVETLLSKALTLAVRLLGFEGYVKTQFAPIDLRPESELEAFRTMRQTRILELLSLGFYTDQEAAELLGTGMRAPGAPPLSGTMFHLGSTNSVDPTGMDTNSSTTGDPGKRGLTGNAPKKAGGASK